MDERNGGPLTIRVRKDDLDGGWVAECPEYPGCFGQGGTREEALRGIADAVTAAGELEAEQSALKPESGPVSPADRALVARATGGGVHGQEVRVEWDDS